jgi:O-antigen ligase
MASRPLSFPRPARLEDATATSVRIAAATLASAALLAVMLAYETKLGVAVLLAVCFIPLAFIRIQFAICGWVVLLFFSRISALEAVPDKLLLFLAVAWLGLLVGRRTKAREALGQNRAIIALAAAFIVWTMLTLAWAPVPGAAERAVKELLYAGLGLLLLLGTILDRRHLRWVLTAFVAGAALSVLWGAAKGGLSVSAHGGEAADLQGRFQGGAGDPNYLAAMLVPAILLAGGLAVQASAARRIMLALATAIIAVGLAATQSRGGLLAAAVCSVVALVIWRRRRARILALIGLAAGATVTFFLANPAAYERITKPNQGSGRIDIWQVAWRVVHDHLLTGAGIAQFPQVSPHYVLQPGALGYVNLIVEKHIVVHNLYLQLWAETGIIGLLLFGAVVLTSLSTAWRAARRFDMLGDVEMSALARAGILGLIGMLTASFFLSNLEAGQLWILLALGPVLATLAERQARASPLLAAPG